jgi:hypothetical protein
MASPAYDRFEQAARDAIASAAAAAEQAQAQAAALLEDGAGDVTAGQPVER